jgi:SAM-dependent methyltransferase
MSERSTYVLGTEAAEMARLGLQHRVWREVMLGAWRRAQLQEGMTVIDVGAGPGYATEDLCDAVGASGHVLAVERSDLFVDRLRSLAAASPSISLDVHQLDLMTAAPIGPADFAWCRWVASFVSDVGQLAGWLARSLKPGATAVFHEYLAYDTWKFAPPSGVLDEFVREVMSSWRASGGEPNVAPSLIGALRAHGFRIISTRPHVAATTPADLWWRWPAAFINVNAERLASLGRVTPEWASAVRDALAHAERDPDCVMTTPMVLEIIAERLPAVG